MAIGAYYRPEAPLLKSFQECRAGVRSFSVAPGYGTRIHLKEGYLPFHGVDGFVCGAEVFLRALVKEADLIFSPIP